MPTYYASGFISSGGLLQAPASAGTVGQAVVLASAGQLGFADVGASSPLTLTASATTETPLTVQAAAGQTAAIQDWENGSGTVHTRVRPDATLEALFGYGSAGIVCTNSIPAGLNSAGGLRFNNYSETACGYIVGDNAGRLRIASADGSVNMVLSNQIITFSNISLTGDGSRFKPSVAIDSASSDEKGFYRSGNEMRATVSRKDVMKWDKDPTAGNTRTLMYSNDHAAATRVKVGANGTGPGGVGRALYLDNV